MPLVSSRGQYAIGSRARIASDNAPGGGLADGELLGEFDGELEGELLGEFDGELDGELLGEFDGDELGELLGELDGLEPSGNSNSAHEIPIARRVAALPPEAGLTKRRRKSL